MRRAGFYCLASLALAAVCAATDDRKRAPSGFTGVRGKKSVAPDAPFAEPDSGQQDKRAPSGFMGMRGKKPFPLALYEEAEAYKRAPSGFLGMRGKKDAELVNYDDYFKRAPSGFLGMRGKKDNDYDLGYVQYPLYYDYKRAPNGFMGLRGKKDLEPADDIKRAPASGFFGTRGKKQPGRSGFFGTRGKKYPYEFRGKFVGVRGKKALNDVTVPDYYGPNNRPEDLNSLSQDLDINQLMLLLTESDTNGYYNNEIEQQG